MLQTFIQISDYLLINKYIGYITKCVLAYQNNIIHLFIRNGENLKNTYC